MARIFKQLLLYLLIFAIILVIANSLIEESAKLTDKLTYSKFLDFLEANKVISVKIDKDKITGIYYDNENKRRKFQTYYYAADMQLFPLLRQHKVEIAVEPPQETPWIMWVVQLVPYIFIILIFILIMRNSISGNSQTFSFGKSRARLWNNKFDKVTFSNVAGVDEAIEELKEIVHFLKYPRKFEAIGARIPKGVLLVGPPGSGKTLLGRAVAGEADVPFYYISGSDFVEMFVGVGAARVRDLFLQAKKAAPSVVFIDEIDAVGRRRGAGYGGGHDEREQTLNQLLVEMDGFEPNIGIIVIAATNRPDVLDPALLRPGRFDRRVVVDKPDIKGRLAILKIHAKNKKINEEVNLEEIAKRTPGFTGADLENLLNEAALIAAKQDKEKIEKEDIEEAIDKVIMGPARKSRILTDKVKTQTAYHEAGHALIAKLTPHADPVKKVTILPRGMALGLTWQMPEDDKYSITKEQLIAEVKVLLGGKAAEKVKFNIQTTGASNDLQRATEIIRDIIIKYGMDEQIGPINVSSSDELFLGRDFMQRKNYSEELAALIDEQIRHYLTDLYNEVVNTLKENKIYLDKIAQLLIEKEIITGEEIDDILKDKIINDWSNND